MKVLSFNVKYGVTLRNIKIYGQISQMWLLAASGAASSHNQNKKQCIRIIDVTVIGCSKLHRKVYIPLKL